MSVLCFSLFYGIFTVLIDATLCMICVDQLFEFERCVLSLLTFIIYCQGILFS